MNLFSFNFPLREYFFCTSPPPTPLHKFCNGPSLRMLDFANRSSVNLWKRLTNHFSTRSLTPLEFSTTTKRLPNCNFNPLSRYILSKIHIKISPLQYLYCSPYFILTGQPQLHREKSKVKISLAKYTAQGSNANQSAVTNQIRLTSALVYFKQLVVRLI